LLLQDGLEVEWNVVIWYVRMIAVDLDCRLIWMQVSDGLCMVLGLLRVFMPCKVVDFFFSDSSSKLVSLIFLYYKSYLRLMLMIISQCAYNSSLRIYTEII
jgi:hypothetical protein